MLRVVFLFFLIKSGFVASFHPRTNHRFVAATARRPLLESMVQACGFYDFVCGEQCGVSFLHDWAIWSMLCCSVGTKTQKAKGIPDNAEIFTQDTRENSDTKGPHETPRISPAWSLIPGSSFGWPPQDTMKGGAKKPELAKLLGAGFVLRCFQRVYHYLPYEKKSLNWGIPHFHTPIFFLSYICYNLPVLSTQSWLRSHNTRIHDTLLGVGFPHS